MELMNINQTMTMSSREIAELTGKQHKHILEDVRKLLSELEIPTADFSAVYKAENGQEYECFNLPKRECLILVSGYSIGLRAKIIDRWQELESQIKTPQTYLEALEALVESEKQKQLLNNKVDNLNTVLDNMTDWASIIRIAKHNNVKESVFKWRKLKAKSKELGYSIKQVPSARYDYQNLYHLDVFRVCYPEFNYNLNKEEL